MSRLTPLALRAAALFGALCLTALPSVAQPAAPAGPPTPLPPAFCIAYGLAEPVAAPGIEIDNAVAVIGARFAEMHLAASARVRDGGLVIAGIRSDDVDRARRLATTVGWLGIYRIDDDPPTPAPGQELPGKAILMTANDPSVAERVFLPPEFTAEDVATAEGGYEAVTATPFVDLTFTEEGAKRLAEVTAGMVGKRLAIAWDGVILSAPVIVEPVTGGLARISGVFGAEDASEMAAILRAGIMTAPLELIADLPPADCIESPQPAGGPPPATPAPN